MEIKKDVVKNAQTVSGAKHQISKTVNTLDGNLIRFEGTVFEADETSQASWDPHGELISFDGTFPTEKDRRNYKLIVIENFELD